MAGKNRDDTLRAIYGTNYHGAQLMLVSHFAGLLQRVARN
jgi:hypothetical protein